jgi:hypothetical protein
MNRQLKFSRLVRKASGKRQIAAAMIGLSLLVGWSIAGTRVIAAINPTLRHELSLQLHPALNVWITPPDYTSAAPIIISTPASTLFEHDTITVPVGSVVSAHLAEQDGDAPELVMGDTEQEFTADNHGDFAATQTLTANSILSIKRGASTLATWKVNVLPDNPPQISLSEPPSITSGKTLRVAYRASDAFAIEDVAVRVTPRNPMPGADNQPVEITLPMTRAKEVARVDFTDLTLHPWAGQPVAVQLVATNAAGKRSETEAVDFTLPERSFFHPVARVLIEERKKLMQHPDDERLREETANVMAGIAHETGDYHGDPVVLMALRSGAVRLILDHGHNTALSVNDLLWQAATRIEDGSSGKAQETLRDARDDLANAIDRNAEPREIQVLTERLHRAMENYVSQISSRHVAVDAGHQAEAGSSKVQ